MYIKLTKFDNTPIWLNAAFIVTIELGTRLRSAWLARNASPAQARRLFAAKAPDP